MSLDRDHAYRRGFAGMGSNLITKELLAAKDYTGIAKKVKDTIALIKSIREKK